MCNMGIYFYTCLCRYWIASARCGTSMISASGEVGDGAGDFDDAMKGAGGKMKLIDGLAEKRHFFFSERAEFFDMLILHFGVGDDAVNIFEAFQLSFAGGGYSFPASRRSLPPLWCRPAFQISSGELRRGCQCGQESVRKFFAGISRFAAGVQRAKPFRVGRVSAGARIHGGNESEAGRKRKRRLGARNGNHPVLEGLAQIFQNRAGKFRKFIQKQNAAMRETDFAGSRKIPPPTRETAEALWCGER